MPMGRRVIIYILLGSASICIKCNFIRLLDHRCFRDHLRRSCIFRRAHSGQLFKMPGKVMHGGIAERIRDLGEIEVLGADQLLGCAKLHICKKFHHAAVVPLAENAGETAVADQIVLADFFQGQLGVEVLFQIGDKLLVDRIPGSVFFGEGNRRRAGERPAFADEL